ncbi:hypothetical protein N7532_010795 [Penicillium argentinense]|uniref:Uncharacterized protein n=1 Tax=Penicillium argentinense TaxID=1131581 RepID=A0A9W9JXY9_9EURO|nr:uncharacterized protein N7532_010795 [Penicillium argentinense]KAJ5086024.1 hypothetical protein N7532_010795 [Penicillium argentinense]
MTNVMGFEPLAAIHERTMTFVSQCTEAGNNSVDIYAVQKDFDIMQELTYHSSLQNEYSYDLDGNALSSLIIK